MVRSGLGPLPWWGLRTTTLAYSVPSATSTSMYPRRSSSARAIVDRAGLQHITVDLHRGASHVREFPLEPLHECADTMRLTHVDVDVRVMSKPHHLQLVALHALNEGMVRPLWLADVACLLRRDGATLDWTMFDDGKAWGAVWARVALILARDVLGEELSHIPLSIGHAPPWGGAAESCARRSMADAARSRGRGGNNGARAGRARAPASRVREAGAGVPQRLARPTRASPTPCRLHEDTKVTT